jgi:uncharacterized phage infection (PIP) family protein YhgE
MIAIDVLYLVDRLEALMSKGWRVPLSSKTLVDEDEFLDIVDQMRVAFPEEIKHAKRIVQERDHVLQQAQAQADQIVQSAKDGIVRLTDEHALIKLAQDQAAQISEQAKSSALAIRHGADEYAEQVLADLQAQLAQMSRQVNTLQAQVTNGLAELRGPTGPESADDLDENP